MTPRVRSAEQGSATVINLALIASVLALGLALAGAAMQVSAKSYAHGIADFAALAAAHHGSCESAGDVLARNPKYHFRLARCEVEGAFAQVEISRTGPSAVSVTARAGPQW